jgi:ABC-type bacteriocin/lantibiotic exporter with double-glycine peptidase domain
LFPPLFQQVFTDNIITHKNPEWFTPLMAIYITLFLIETSVWIAFSILRRKNQAKIIAPLRRTICGQYCGYR